MKFTLLLLSLLALASCDYFIDRAILQDEDESYVSPYKGIWMGKYSGEDHGDLTIDVAKNGYTSVTKISQYNTETSVFSGMVRDDGAMQSVVLESGFTLLGNLRNQNGNASGTWKQNARMGTWTVTKQ